MVVVEGDLIMAHHPLGQEHSSPSAVERGKFLCCADSSQTVRKSCLTCSRRVLKYS